MDKFIKARVPEFFRKDYPLTAESRIRTGGNALFYAGITRLKALKQTILFSKDHDLPLYVLGNGSNVLIADGGIRGIVIKLGNNFKSIHFDDKHNKVTAGAGASLMALGAEIADHGHPEYVYMGVIPGTVGGAVTMNAGINADEKIEKHFLSALLFNPLTLDTEEYFCEEMNFGYRKSSIKFSDKIMISCTFVLPDAKDSPGQEARQKLKKLLDLRRATQPKNTLTFGSTFKNPENTAHSAGWLLDKAGMKGVKEGGAMISPEHANWIINTGNAKSRDIKKLIQTAQARVLDEFGISLEREVIFIPEDRFQL